MIKNFQKVEDREIDSLGVKALATRPNSISQYGQSGLSADDLKAWFDQLGTAIAKKFNTMCDAFSSDTAGQYIRVDMKDIGVESLYDVLEAIKSGAIASKLLVGDTALSEVIKALRQGEATAKEDIDKLKEESVSTVELNIDKDQYILTFSAKNAAGDVLYTYDFDLPLESVVVNGSYYNGNIILTLKNGHYITIPLVDIVEGLVSSKEFRETISRLDGDIATAYQNAVDHCDEKFSTVSIRCEAISSELAGHMQSQTETNRSFDSRIKAIEEASFGNIYSTIEDSGVAFEKKTPKNAEGIAILSSVGTASVNEEKILVDQIIKVDDQDWDDGMLSASGGVIVANGSNQHGLQYIRCDVKIESSPFSICILIDTIAGTYSGDAYLDVVFYSSSGEIEYAGARIALPHDIGRHIYNIDCTEGDRVVGARIYSESGCYYEGYSFALDVAKAISLIPIVSTLDSVVSVGKNLLPKDALDLGNWSPENDDDTYSRYILDLADGYYCISAILRSDYNVSTYLYLQKKVGGKWTNSNSALDENNTPKNGYFLTNTSKPNSFSPLWFKVEGGAQYCIARRKSVSASPLAWLSELQIQEVSRAGVSNTSYEPYVEDRLNIPPAIKALEGAGLHIGSRYYNYIDLDRKVYVQTVGEREYAPTDGYSETMTTDFFSKTWYVLAEPRLVDISLLMNTDGSIPVHQGGRVRFLNEKNAPVPSTIFYQVKEVYDETY